MGKSRMTMHNDALKALNERASLKGKLIAAHQSICEIFPFIARIAITIYDPETNILKTYLHSSGDDHPLDNYQSYSTMHRH